MGIFDGISDRQVKESQYFERGNYVTPGRYLVEVLRVKEGRTRPPKQTGFFVVEMRVLETTSPEKHPIKSTAAWMTTLDKDAAIGNIRHFVAAACNTPIDDVGIELCKVVVSQDNPCAGVVLQVDAFEIRTRSDKPFTKVKFTFIAESVAELQKSA